MRDEGHAGGASGVPRDPRVGRVGALVWARKIQAAGAIPSCTNSVQGRTVKGVDGDLSAPFTRMSWSPRLRMRR